MALLLLLDRDQYFQGSVVLRRGDDWQIDCTVVDRIGSVDTVKDLTGASVTGFFPASGAPISVSGTPINVADGRIRFAVPHSLTPLVSLYPEGVNFYATVSGTAEGLFSVALPSPDLEINDRIFGT